MVAAATSTRRHRWHPPEKTKASGELLFESNVERRMRTKLAGFLAALLPLLACAGAPRSMPPATVEVTAPPVFLARVSGAGRPVVFIPDLEAPGEIWDTTLAHLGGRVEAHVIEVAGFAGNPVSYGPLMPRLRDGLATYLREHARGAILVGHMFGAQVAYWLAMTEPELVRGIIAIDAPPSRFDGTVDPEADEVRRAWGSASADEFARGIKHRIGSMMADQSLAETIAAKAVRSSQPVIAEAFYDMMTRDLRAQIPNIKAPVLVLLTTGNLPPEMLPTIEVFYREELGPIARHRLVVVPGSKHYVMFDAPKAFFVELDRFLASQAPGEPPSARSSQRATEDSSP
jgi:N-formylmaleamate deformylase